MLLIVQAQVIYPALHFFTDGLWRDNLQTAVILWKTSLTNGDRISYDAPLLGAKKVVHDEIPQCCILICQYKQICKC